MNRRIPEPCLCGADDCPRCFPLTRHTDPDDDSKYDREEQEKLDYPDEDPSEFR
jgi:hypothetical protein